MPSVLPARLTDAQRRFVRLRVGLNLVRYVVLGGALAALLVFGVLHP